MGSREEGRNIYRGPDHRWSLCLDLSSEQGKVVKGSSLFLYSVLIFQTIIFFSSESSGGQRTNLCWHTVEGYSPVLPEAPMGTVCQKQGSWSWGSLVPQIRGEMVKFHMRTEGWAWYDVQKIGYGRKVRQLC